VKRLVDGRNCGDGSHWSNSAVDQQAGAYRVQGKTAATARELLDDARALEDAGAFAIVLEVVPREIASLNN